MGAFPGKGTGGVRMLASRSSTNAQEKLAFLNCRRLPGRLNTSEAALLLGFQEHDIAFLIAAKLLAPLGKPAPNAPKYFAAAAIAERASDAKWLSNATKEVAKQWLRKNQRKSVLTRSAVQFDSARELQTRQNARTDRCKNESAVS
jgi:hypothetical protein